MNELLIANMEAAIKTVKERGEAYGDMLTGYYANARLLQAMLPPGTLKLETEADYARLIIYVLISTKLHRYRLNYNNVGHKDSIHDLANYAHILETFDDYVKEVSK